MNFLEKPLVLFLKEHLMPTLISFVIANVIYLLVPSNNWIITKIGDNWFRLFIFCVCFILIYFLLSINERIKNHRNCKNMLNQRRKKIQRSMKSILKIVESMLMVCLMRIVILLGPV